MEVLPLDSQDRPVMSSPEMVSVSAESAFETDSDRKGEAGSDCVTGCTPFRADEASASSLACVRSSSVDRMRYSRYSPALEEGMRVEWNPASDIHAGDPYAPVRIGMAKGW